MSAPIQKESGAKIEAGPISPRVKIRKDSDVGGQGDRGVGDVSLKRGTGDELKSEPEAKRARTTSDEGGRMLVQVMLMEAVESLSVVSRSLEKWPIFVSSIGTSEEQRQRERDIYEKAVEKHKQKMGDHLRRFIRKSRKLVEEVKQTRVFDNVDLPVDLVNHVDAFMSLNTWLRGLYEDVNYENACAKGELYTLGSLHSTFKVYINLLDTLGSQVKPVDFVSASLPPTAKRSPIDRYDETVEVLQVLALLQKPIVPVELGENLNIRTSQPESSNT